jgi:hypothetical protein
LAVIRQDARPLGSAGRGQARSAFVSELVEGMLVRVVVYLAIDEARSAAERLAEERAKVDV